MNEPFGRDRSQELIVENLIKMLGKSNERVIDLTKRVAKLELYITESIIDDSRIDPIIPTNRRAF